MVICGLVKVIPQSAFELPDLHALGGGCLRLDLWSRIRRVARHLVLFTSARAII